MNFASWGSKCALSTPLTRDELAGGKLLLFIALHSSSLALEKDGLSLTGGRGRREKEEQGSQEGNSGEKERRKRAALVAAALALISRGLADNNPVTFFGTEACGHLPFIRSNATINLHAFVCAKKKPQTQT